MDRELVMARCHRQLCQFITCLYLFNQLHLHLLVSGKEQNSIPTGTLYSHPNMKLYNAIVLCNTLGGKVRVEHVLRAMKKHTRMNLAYACYWRAHGTPFYAPAVWGVMNENDACVPHVLHSISHLLCAVLVLGSAMCNTENSMFVTPVSVGRVKQYWVEP